MHKVLLGAVLSGVASVAAAEDAAVAQTAKVLPQVVSWRRDIHQHPELGNRETRTAKLVATQLKALGLEVRTGIAHTGVVALLKGGKPGPKLAIRADMDALPVTEEVDLPFASKVRSTYAGQEVGVMHACGHDAHTAMTLGVATALAGQRADLPGEVMFIFQPAEEGSPPGEQGGAKLMLEEGLFKDFKPDAIFGMHVFYTLQAGQVGVREGPMLAGSDRFKIRVLGAQTHGAQPWRGVDPIVTAAAIVSQAQSIVSRQIDISKFPAVLSFGLFQGGVRYNIIPDKVELEGTIRTFDDGMRDEIMVRLRRLAEGVATAQGAKVELEVPMEEVNNPVTRNDPAMTRRMRPSLERAVGAANVVEVPPNMVAEDFSYYANAVPGVFFFVGSAPPGEHPANVAPNHSPRFFLDEKALEVGTRAMLQLAWDFLAPPSN
ncbi:amidohydrolase [Tahibacter amnicola]|uniref:Amidohydrolase n=1 Tax=Tahibacter amnicola TaxID=2976241 RepID=A0ABY6BET4_9GAMM|nr:amidohydrolase [Tahibacter amnicola]UXI68101.1 amidohydrolase [Tahibacter amnicola]